MEVRTDRPPRQLGAVSVAPAHVVPRDRADPRPIETPTPQAGLCTFGTVDASVGAGDGIMTLDPAQVRVILACIKPGI